MRAASHHQDGCFANLGKDDETGGVGGRYGPRAGGRGAINSSRPFHVSATFAETELSAGRSGAYVDVKLSQVTYSLPPCLLPLTYCIPLTADVCLSLAGRPAVGGFPVVQAVGQGAR